MFDLGNFLLESGLSLGLFYMLYWLLLRRQTFFGLNRAVLLMATLLSLALPFLHIPLPSHTPESPIIYYVVDQFSLEGVVFFSGQEPSPGNSQLRLSEILLFTYLAGLLFFFFRFLAELLHIVSLAGKNTKIPLEGMVVVLVKKKLAPFSFFRWTFIMEEEWDSGKLEEILSHEKEHIRKWHSLDMLLLEFITIVQWFNPFVWLGKFSLKELHEYQADNAVIRKGTNTLQYQHIILQQVFGVQFFRYVNHLNQSYIKKRFAMMTRNRSGRIAVFRTLSIVPLAAILIALFAFDRESLQRTASSAPTGELSFVSPFEPGENITIAAAFGPMNHPFTKQKVQHRGIDFSGKAAAPAQGNPYVTPTGIGQDTVIFKVVEVMPRFRGEDIKAFQHWLQTELRYPEKMKAEHKSATVFVSFVIEPSGKVTRIRAISTRNINGKSISLPEFEQEALRAVKSSPDWEPGKQRGKNVAVEMTVPIRFMLDEGDKKDPAPIVAETGEQVFFVVEEMPSFSYMGGDSIGAFRRYVADNLVYPEEAQRIGMSGRIFIRFIVEPDGSVSDVDIVRGLETDKDELKSAAEALNREALRVVKESPPWKPGKQRGHAVRVAFTFPIEFVLKEKEAADSYMKNLELKK
jgi:TonB family protein